jgi:hypothetical protein
MLAAAIEDTGQIERGDDRARLPLGAEARRPRLGEAIGNDRLEPPLDEREVLQHFRHRPAIGGRLLIAQRFRYGFHRLPQRRAPDAEVGEQFLQPWMHRTARIGLTPTLTRARHRYLACASS